MQTSTKLALAIFAGTVLTAGARADLVSLSDAQMDAVAAGGVDKVDGFVCPVITTENVLNSPNSGTLGDGHYTIGGPDVSVPMHATNGDGTGTPGGEHSHPGDTDYSAIWGTR